MKPMLAVEAEDFEALTYPLLASYKLDGIRCLITVDGPRTRSLKPVPNKYIAGKLADLPRSGGSVTLGLYAYFAAW